MALPVNQTHLRLVETRNPTDSLSGLAYRDSQSEERIAANLAALRLVRQQERDERPKGLIQLAKELPFVEKIAISAGAVAIAALLLNGQAVARRVLDVKASFGDMTGATYKGYGAADRQKAMTYNGKFHIPPPTEKHRELIAGEMIGDKSLINVVSIRDYINKQNPTISLDEAADLIMAEVSADQIAAGVPKNDVRPTFLVRGQHIRLPLEYGVGKIVRPDEPASARP